MKKLELMIMLFLVSAGVMFFSKVGISEETTDELEIIEREFVTQADYDNLGDLTCDNAELYADVSNRLANSYSQILEPFYSTYGDAKKEARAKALTLDIGQYEGKSNDLKKERNRAWVKQAECLYENGEKSKALDVVYHALEYISHKQLELWMRAKVLMLNLLNS